MHSFISRKKFVHTMAMGGTGFLGALYLPRFINSNGQTPAGLYALSNELLKEWADTILKLQATDKLKKNEYGGIISPDTGKIPGRCGDALYPLFCMAENTGDSKYMDAAHMVYEWMESHVSDTTDGAWLNEQQKNSWKGITVFTTIAICETLKNHHKIIDPVFREILMNRVLKAANYIYNNFTIDYGNINYPVSASYALMLAGVLLDMPRFKEKGSALARQALGFISATDKLLFGEGQPYYQISKKGCVPVDLGYNVEESLPALVQYGLLAKDEAVLAAVTASMQAHMQFMLPDGAWDNSWGTRIYKWTYWGSRTSDGCQTAYALMKDRDPRFYKVALKNLQLLKACTFNGLLQGGPHLEAHGIVPNVHHTFCHMKALANIINYGDKKNSPDIDHIQLPRETVKGIRFFSDIQTWLLATGKYRATITGYDREYKDFKNGHATGGAISLLWHLATGPILVASMNEYQLFEKDNMQADTDPLSMPLTPRIELKTKTGVYSNICDLSAQVTVKEQNGQVMVAVTGRLVNGKQEDPPGGAIICNLSYLFTKTKITLQFKCDAKATEEIRVVVPVVCKSGEKFTVKGNTVKIQKAGAGVTVSADKKMILLPTTTGRVFNFVPGMEAIPLAVLGHSATFVIEVF
ncbi:MAG: hypothetical protein ABIR15_19410 [Chitinophagaceae bacterium]